MLYSNPLHVGFLLQHREWEGVGVEEDYFVLEPDNGKEDVGQNKHDVALSRALGVLGPPYFRH